MGIKRTKLQIEELATGQVNPDAAKTPHVNERVLFIAKMISTGLYEPSITPHELSQKWGIAPATVRHDAMSARSLILSDENDREMISLKIKALLQRSALVAITSPDNTMEPRDRCRALTDTAMALARIFGVEAPKKIEVRQMSDIEQTVLQDPIGASLFMSLGRIPSEAEIEKERHRIEAQESAAN